MDRHVKIGIVRSAAEYFTQIEEPTCRATLVDIFEKSASVSTWMLYSALMGKLYIVAWNSSAAEHRFSMITLASSSARLFPQS